MKMCIRSTCGHQMLRSACAFAQFDQVLVCRNTHMESYLLCTFEMVKSQPSVRSGSTLFVNVLYKLQLTCKGLCIWASGTNPHENTHDHRNNSIDWSASNGRNRSTTPGKCTVRIYPNNTDLSGVCYRISTFSCSLFRIYRNTSKDKV